MTPSTGIDKPHPSSFDKLRMKGSGRGLAVTLMPSPSKHERPGVVKFDMIPGFSAFDSAKAMAIVRAFREGRIWHLRC